MDDRLGRSYPETVKPDISIIGGDDFEHIHNDKKVQAALMWLKSGK